MVGGKEGESKRCWERKPIPAKRGSRAANRQERSIAQRSENGEGAS